MYLSSGPVRLQFENLHLQPIQHAESIFTTCWKKLSTLVVFLSRTGGKSDMSSFLARWLKVRDLRFRLSPPDESFL